jgi:tRNA nucleotidyltransferase (CCA-adding enzyme)
VSPRGGRGTREHLVMDVPATDELLDAVARLPAVAPLIERLGEKPPVALVGGAVRDVLMGGLPGDLDFVVEGDAAALAAGLGGTVKVHDRFGTSTVTLDGFSYDLARARRETYSRPGALPDVVPAPLEEDLHRRDFTVNAMAIGLNGRRRGELLTAPCALGDLDARLLRVLHDQSFIDDPTRLFRLCRYRSRLGFAIEIHTAALARVAIDDHAVGTVSGSRVGAELRLLAREPDPVAALRSLRELRLDAEIDPDFGIEDPQLGERALELLAAAPDARRDRLALAVAAIRVPRRRLAALLDTLAFEAGDRDAIVAASTRAQELARSLSGARAPSEIAAAVGGACAELVALAGALGPADQARAWLERLRHVALEIDGGDLLSAGIPEGPAIGVGLRAALMAKLDGRASGRDQELAEALRAATGG